MAITTGDGYAVAQNLDDLGEGYGFRKVRANLGLTAFGANVIVVPAGFASGFHFHDEQEELYLVLDGEIEIEFGDGTRHRLQRGGTARVDAHVHRRVVNVGDEDAAYFVAGGKDGYVGRDGRLPEGETRAPGPH